jgi:hypothetical protein
MLEFGILVPLVLLQLPHKIAQVVMLESVSEIQPHLTDHLAHGKEHFVLHAKLQEVVFRLESNLTVFQIIVTQAQRLPQLLRVLTILFGGNQILQLIPIHPQQLKMLSTHLSVIFRDQLIQISQLVQDILRLEVQVSIQCGVLLHLVF